MTVPFYKKFMPLNRHRHWLIKSCLLILALLPTGARAWFSPEETTKFEEQKLAAEKGDSSAQLHLGRYYLYGKFEEQKLAAEKGDSSAQLHLGHYYLYGWGVTKNEAEAKKWYTISSEQGNSIAKLYLKTLSEREKTGERDVTSTRQASVQDFESILEASGGFRTQNEHQPRAESYNLNYAARAKPVRVLAAWVMLIPVFLSVILLVFFLNFFQRSRLENNLQDDIRFKSRFQPHSRQYQPPKNPVLWSVTGLVLFITGPFVFISLQGVGVALGLLMMIGGYCALAYNSNEEAGEQNQGPKDRLLEAKFQNDRVCLTYSISGQRELVFGPNLRIWIGTREKLQGGASILGEVYAQVLTGVGVYATFKDAFGKVELELDFPGAAEFIALCRHHGAEINLSLNLDADIAARLAATPSWQPSWQPGDLDQASETAQTPTKPKLWNPQATAIWSFIFCAALGSWLQAANWRALGEPEKARRCMVWFYGYIVSTFTYLFILPYFLPTPELLQYTWAFLTSIIWYFLSGKEQIKYVRESQLGYQRRGWLKPVLTTCAILSVWLGICFGSDEFFQATLRADAFRGDAAAQTSLAWLYAGGKGVSEDQEESSRLFLKAAKQGDRNAQAAIGIRLQLGKGVPKNDVEALKWLRLSANQGSEIAQNMMGACYFHGLGADINYEEAAKWYMKSAENEYADAQIKLGDCYFNGHGVNKDMVEATKWYRRAANQGSAFAQTKMGLAYESGLGVTTDQATAVQWFQRAATQGDHLGELGLGIHLVNGSGVDKDLPAGLAMIRKSVAGGNVYALQTLGGYHVAGLHGLSKDLVEGYAYLCVAAPELESARSRVAQLEKDMAPVDIASGKHRAQMIKKEIDAKIAEKNAGT